MAAQEPAADPFNPGFYAGAELGGMRYDNACDPAALECDQADTAGAVFAGYRFASRFMMELGKRDLGEARAVYPRLTSTVDVVGDVDGYDLSALMRFPLGRAWEFYLRGGAYRADVRTASSEFSAAASDWSPSGGGGFAWHFRPTWEARFQYLYVADIGDPETGEANIAMLSAGISYLFGARRSPAPASRAAAAEPPAPPAPPAQPPQAASPSPPLPLCPPPLPAWDTNVYFAFDSAEARNVESLEGLAQRLREQPQAPVNIRGYTDTSGARVYNLELSRRRAEAVASYFRQRGIDGDRVSVEWAGPAEPVVGAAAEQAAALSRRVRVTSPSVTILGGNCRRAEP